MTERRRVTSQVRLEERLATQASDLRAAADKLPPGAQRESLLRQARQDEAASRMSAWMDSPLRAPS